MEGGNGEESRRTWRVATESSLHSHSEKKRARERFSKVRSRVL